MPGTYEINWDNPSVLHVRRSGLFSIDDAHSYQRDMERALQSAVRPWGIVVDVRGAPAQTPEVQPTLEHVMRSTELAGVTCVAIVVDSTVTKMQQRRMTTQPGLHAVEAVSFHTELDAALEHVRAAVAAAVGQTSTGPT
jgi:hypothetical protein